MKNFKPLLLCILVDSYIKNRKKVFKTSIRLKVMTALFSNIDETRAEKPVGYLEENDAIQNSFVSKLNGKSGGNKIDPSLVFRVMAGDTISIRIKAFYKSNGPSDKKATSSVDEVTTALANVMSNGESATTNRRSMDNVL